MSVIALIPARSGSKGLPGKNIRPFNGTSLLALAIQQARACKAINRIIVSTDSEEYAHLARKEGAEVPFLRPAQLSQDHSTDLETFQHALQELKLQPHDDHLIVHLRVTYPVRTPKQISDCIELLQKNPQADSVRSVCLSAHSPYKMYQITAGQLRPVVECNIPEAYNQPRQILPPVYEHNGAIDIIRSRIIFNGSMSGSIILPYLMDHNYDIDTLEDFKLAETALSSGENS